MEDEYMMKMGMSESRTTKLARMQEAVLASANAKLEKEADPDSVTRSVLPVIFNQGSR